MLSARASCWSLSGTARETQWSTRAGALAFQTWVWMRCEPGATFSICAAATHLPNKGAEQHSTTMADAACASDYPQTSVQELEQALQAFVGRHAEGPTRLKLPVVVVTSGVTHCALTWTRWVNFQCSIASVHQSASYQKSGSWQHAIGMSCVSLCAHSAFMLILA